MSVRGLLDAAVERTASRVIRAVGVLVGRNGLRLAVAGRIQRRAHAVLLQLSGHGIRALLRELEVEGLVRDGIGVAVDVGGGNLRVVEHARQALQGLGGIGANVGLAEVEEDAVL